jgi:hypothetical protein
LIEGFNVEDRAEFFFAPDEEICLVCVEFFVVGLIAFSDGDIGDRL